MRAERSGVVENMEEHVEAPSHEVFFQSQSPASFVRSGRSHEYTTPQIPMMLNKFKDIKLGLVPK